MTNKELLDLAIEKITKEYRQYSGKLYKTTCEIDKYRITLREEYGSMTARDYNNLPEKVKLLEIEEEKLTNLVSGMDISREIIFDLYEEI